MAGSVARDPAAAAERVSQLLDEVDTGSRINLPANPAAAAAPTSVEHLVTRTARAVADGLYSLGEEPALTAIIRRTMTTAEAAARLGCSEQYIVSLVDQGELGGLSIGNKWLVSRDGVDRLARIADFKRRFRKNDDGAGEP